MMSSDREKIEIIIRDISQLEINETNTRDRNISNIERLIQLKKDAVFIQLPIGIFENYF